MIAKPKPLFSLGVPHCVQDTRSLGTNHHPYDYTAGFASVTKKRDVGKSILSPGSKLRENLTFWAPVFMTIAIACVILTWSVIGGPNSYLPVGIDLMGHLTKGYLFADRWRSGSFSDWCYEWYMGATLSQYYPPLSNWVCGALQLFFGNLFLSFKVFALGCLIGGGLAVAGLTRRLGGNTTACAMAGILYSTANYTLFSVFIDGTLGRTLGLPFFPLLLWALIDLAENQTARNWGKTSLYVVILCLAHAMQAYHLFLMIGVFMVIRCTVYKDIWRRLLVMAEASLSGVLLASFWVVPGLTQLELHGVPYSRPEMVGERTAGLSDLLRPGFTGDGIVTYALGSTVMYALAMVGVLILWSRYQRRIDAIAFLGSIIFIGSLIYGPQNPLYRIVPLGRNLAPVRFTNAIILPAAICAGFVAGYCVELLSAALSRVGSVPRIFPAAITVLLISLAVVRVNVPVGLPRPSYYGWLRTLVERIPSGGTNPFDSGRVAEEMPNTASETAFIPVQYGFNLTVGWNIEGTPHVYTLQDHNIAYTNDTPEYVLRNWYLWNTRSALIDERTHASMAGLLLREGWSKVDTERGVSLFTLSEPSSYFMNIDSDVLVIGRSSFCVASLFPWVTQGRDANPLNYDEDYTDLFRCIVLYDLPPIDKRELEDKVIHWVNEGKQVIVDLSFTDSIPDFLGVRSRQIVLDGEVQLVPTGEGGSSFGDAVNLHLSPGRGAVYTGLDETYLTTSTDQGEVALCGVRQLQTGDVWFVGGHIPRLVQPEGLDEARRVWGAILSECGPRMASRPSSFPVQDELWDSRGVSFRYDVPQEKPLVLSVTYTPRWKAKVDGMEWPIYSHENLVMLMLPSSEHSVTLEYGTTGVAIAGCIISACAFLWIGLRTLLPKAVQRKIVSLGLSRVRVVRSPSVLGR